MPSYIDDVADAISEQQRHLLDGKIVSLTPAPNGCMLVELEDGSHMLVDLDARQTWQAPDPAFIDRLKAIHNKTEDE